MSRLLTGSWEPIINLFLFKVQKNVDFFEYYNLSDEEALELAKKRAVGFLLESISRLTLACTPDVDFHDYDFILETFNFELTADEVDLFASLMFEKLMEKDYGKLSVYSNVLSSQDIKALFSGYGERNSFVAFFNKIKDDNSVLIDSYASKDRLTGARKAISSYDM